MPRKSAADKVLDNMQALCRQRGGRLTPQRRAVLQKLAVSRGLLSAHELQDLLLPQDASITPASVYRSLDHAQ